MHTQIMKIYQKIIDFTGMEFHPENHPSNRLRQRSAAYRSRRTIGITNNVARNVRSIFQTLFGF